MKSLAGAVTRKQPGAKIIRANMEVFMRDKNDDKSTWAIGGDLVIGAGVGLFFLQASGQGLLLTSIIRV
jgi:hypothetical protein